MTLPALIAVVRVERTGDVTEAHLRALLNDQVRAVEIALTGDDPWRLLERACVTLGDVATVGAGTVLSVADARRAAGVGARFVASPVAPGGLEDLDIPAIPGVHTPSDAHAAVERGFADLKLFPARLGPRYLSDLLGPFPGLRIRPSGGVDPGSLAAWWHAGAAGAFLGSSLLSAGGALRRPDEIAALAGQAASAWTTAPHGK